MDKQLIKLAKATLLILDKKSWDSIELVEIYKKFKINKKNLHKKITNKLDLLRNINRYFDLQLRKASDNIDQSNHKDMIFEVIMMRFDIFQDYRKSIINVFDFLKRRPQELVSLLPSFVGSASLLGAPNSIKYCLKFFIYLGPELRCFSSRLLTTSLYFDLNALSSDFSSGESVC